MYFTLFRCRRTGRLFLATASACLFVGVQIMFEYRCAPSLSLCVCTYNVRLLTVRLLRFSTTRQTRQGGREAKRHFAQVLSWRV